MSQVYFEDVEPGYEVGPVVKMPTREQLDAFTTVWGSQTGRFTSDEAAQKEGFSGVILPGNMSMALLAQVLTEWAGSAGKLKRLEVRLPAVRAARGHPQLHRPCHGHGDGGR